MELGLGLIIGFEICGGGVEVGVGDGVVITGAVEVGGGAAEDPGTMVALMT